MKEIRIKVAPNMKKEGVEELKDGRFSVSVKADRKGGQANARAILVLSEFFKVPVEHISIVSGHTSATKTMRIK